MYNKSKINCMPFALKFIMKSIDFDKINENM